MVEVVTVALKMAQPPTTAQPPIMAVAAMVAVAANPDHGVGDVAVEAEAEAAAKMAAATTASLPIS